jgi:hypothetical protein
MAMLDYGKNVSVEVKGNDLIIKVDLSKNFGLSKAGKSTIIATTSGNKMLPSGQYFGLNIYKPV